MENGNNNLTKEQLTDSLIKGQITSTQIDALMGMLGKTDFRNLVRRIFDINETDLINNSSADRGMLGFLNRRGQKKKNRHFEKDMREPNLRQSKKIIVAEGDSWFEYPVFLKDILDWIIKKSENPVYSLAYGGDWIANIIYEEEYIPELTRYQPEVFLISGGGNDLVGDGRLGILVNKYSMVKNNLNLPYTLVEQNKIDKITQQDFGNGEVDSVERAKMIVRGTKFLNGDFQGLLNTFELMYKLFFKSIDLSEKFYDMKIITQGYDFAIPSKNRSIKNHFMRWASGNGKWLYYPLVRKGIYDPYDQKCIVSAMIYEFNEMLIKVSEHRNSQRMNGNPNGSGLVYHIDCRGALRKADWADELHPYSEAFHHISKVYLECIDGKAPVNSSSPYVYPVRKYS